MVVKHGLRKERMLRVFENRILRRIFIPKKNLNGEWRRLHNEGAVHRSPGIYLTAEENPGKPQIEDR